MPLADIFTPDAFSLISLTDAVEKVPFKPGRIGTLGLFASRGITTTIVMVEERDGRLSLIPTNPRGAPPSALGPRARRGRPFAVPQFQLESNILADEVQGIRAFGSDSAVLGVQALVNERLAEMRAMFEITLEYQRIGALKGLILDADGTTVLLNLFTEFGVAQQTYVVDWNGPADITGQIIAIKRLVEDELGGEPVSNYRAFAGDLFFDRRISIPEVKATYQYQQGQFLREDHRGGFEYGGVVWENYRGSVGGIPYIASNEAYVFPEAAGMFKTYFAPADFIETVNTMGLPIYAKQVVDDELQRFVRLHVQSNALSLNLRPRAVVKVTLTS